VDCREAASKLGAVVSKSVLDQDMVRGGVGKLSSARESNNDVLVKDVGRSQGIGNTNDSRAREGRLL